MGSLVPLVSYPKSGNTWVRAFLTSVWRDGMDVDIDHLMIPNISGRAVLDSLLGIHSADVPDEQLVALRKDLYELAARTSPADRRLYVKVHDAYLQPTPACPAPIDTNSIERFVYIVRDPRDVIPSLARHLNISIESALATLLNPRATLSVYPGRVGAQLPQMLSSWGMHVRSWLHGPTVPHLLMRYEQMVADPHQSFRSLLDFLGIETSAAALNTAVDATRFSVLREKERRGGFAEKTPTSNAFFLTPDQLNRLVASQADQMVELGYL